MSAAQANTLAFVTVATGCVTPGAPNDPSRHISGLGTVSPLALCDPFLHHPSIQQCEAPVLDCAPSFCHHFTLPMSLYSTFDLEDDDGLRRLLYLCAFLLVFLPYFNAIAQLWPLRLGDVRWRFTAAGTMSGILMLPFIGMSFAMAIARSVGHKGISRLIGGVAVLTVLFLAAGLGLFFLDSLQLKSIVRDAEMSQFLKAVASATVAIVVSIIAFSFLSFVAFRGRKGALKPAPKSGKKAAADEPVGLLIGQNYTKE